MNEIMYITCSLSSIHFVREICVQRFSFFFLLSTIQNFCQIKGMMSNDGIVKLVIQMKCVLKLSD